MKLVLAATVVLAAGVLLVASAVRLTRDSRVIVTVSERSYGHGRDRVWVFSPHGRKPRAVVVFVHGAGDEKETTPYYHRPWLRHLALEGYDVLYPRYERTPGQADSLRHIVSGVRLAMRHVPSGLPAAAIGYSRGGRLVVDYASVAHGVPPVPRGILSVFPAGAMDPVLDLGSIAAGTTVTILTGDRDEVVGTTGANQLITQLAVSRFPYSNLRIARVRSHGFFLATHLSALDDSADARAAFWAPADRIVAGVVDASERG
jgi:dienelactone hydrolase